MSEPVAMQSYRPGQSNTCPSCGATQFYVGRVVAECARCEAPMPIVAPRAPVSTPFVPDRKEAA